jgi:hypothetical protein
VGWGGTTSARLPAARAAPLAALACAAVATAAAAATAYVAGRCAWAALTAATPKEAASHAALGLAAAGPLIVALTAYRGAITLASGAAKPLRLRPLLPTAAVIAACVAFQAALASGSFFTGDDWLHLVTARGADSPDAAYLASPVFIHYAPGLKLGYWALEAFAPLDWGLALAGLLVLFAGSLFLFHRICVQLFGDRRSNLVPLLMFGSSVVLVTSFLWFADGLHKLPSTFLSLLAVYAYLRHQKERSRIALAVSVAAVALGLLFYVKAILVPLYLVLIRLLFLETKERNPARTLWRERWTWLAFAPPIAIYLWNYAAGYAELAGDRPPLGLVGEYVATAWFRGVAPALGGVYIGLDQRTLAIVIAVLAQLVFVAVVAASLRRNPRAWRAWAFALAVFVVNAGLIGFGRLESFGFERVAWDPRYHTELAWLLPLALAFAFHGTRPPPRRRARAALALYVLLAAVTGTLMSLWWRDTQSAVPDTYVQNLRADAAHMRDPEVVDHPVPAFLVSARDHPWDRLEHLAPALGSELDVVAGSADPHVVGIDGRILPARLYPVSDRLTGLRPDECVRTAQLPAAAPSLYARITYDVPRPAAGKSGRMRSGGLSGTIPLDRRSGQVVVSLRNPLRLALPAGSKACVRETTVGWLGS